MSNEPKQSSPTSANWVKPTLLIAGLGVLALIIVSTLGTLQGGSSDKATDNTFLGITQVPQEQLAKLYPKEAGQPILVEFTSKFCLECKKMTPMVHQLAKKNTTLVFHQYDIQKDKKTNPEVFEAFKPTIAPVLVFINRGGTIETVLYGEQSEEAVQAKIDAIVLDTPHPEAEETKS